MKSLRISLIAFGALVAIAGTLLWFLPARWILPWLEPRLHGLQLQQVSGSVWDGRADAVVAADAQTLGQLQWQLSRRALLGQPRMRVQFTGPQLAFSGELARLPNGDMQARDAHIHAALATLGGAWNTPWGQPRGELQVAVVHVVLHGGWPMQLDAQATWRDAAVRTTQGDLALGEVRARAQAEQGVIRAQLHDAGGGPLQLAGALQLSPLGWRLDATLRARQTDPALQRWLATLGTPAADGSVHIQRHGGLAGIAPAPPIH
ncbi:type II secretion system protein N [Rhodanobacter ginsengiterrae]|uniref:type II secretion system protein N n=1 Tax=Rhodanobacter ginsengiterrae TaxID=2008451 RepID=UPI003CEA4A41